MKEQRRRVNGLLAKNPSLQAELAETITEAYATAVTFVSVETGILEEDFSAECPYEVKEILEMAEPSERSRNGPAKRPKARGKRSKRAALRWQRIGMKFVHCRLRRAAEVFHLAMATIRAVPTVMAT